MKRTAMLLMTLVLAVLCLLMLPTQASAASESDLAFTLNSDGVSYSVTGCNTSASGSLEIPATYNGKPVTGIGTEAFSGCASLTSITIPDSVTSIGKGAFSGCSKLESITIPFVGGSPKTALDTYQYPFGYIFGTSSYIGGTATKQYYYGFSTSSTTNNTYYIPASLKSVTVTGGHIPFGAFYNCSKLTSVTISDSVTNIGVSAFYNCTSLVYNTYDNAKYLGNSTNPFVALVQAKSTSIDSCAIHEDTRFISTAAFSGCIGLTEIVIPDNVTSIGRNTFYDCTALTSITIPGSMTSIGSNAFNNCSNLKDVYITNANGWCKLSFDDTGANPMTYAKQVHILDENGNDVTHLVLDETVTSIPYRAFFGCTSLTSVAISSSVTGIGSEAFFGCTSLTSVAISSSVTSIGSEAFIGCTGLKRVDITDIAAWCAIDFLYGGANPLCYAGELYLNGELVTDLVIPDNVTTIGECAFYNYTKLSSITLSSNVTCIGADAFFGCAGLTSITIPSSLTGIGNGAFYGCTSLKRVDITDIAAWCKISFYNNTAHPLSYADELYLNGELVTNLVIPDNVTTIGAFAFYNYTKLTGVTLLNSVTSIDSFAFADCTNLTEVTIPSSVTNIGVFAFSGSGLREIVIPDNVTTIGESAFFDCEQLEAITVPFIGGSQKTVYVDSFGYIFGNSGSTIGDIGNIGTPVEQYYYDSYSQAYKRTTYYLPDSLKTVTVTGGTITRYAFENCSGLTEVILADGVTNIDIYAFTNCAGLTDIVIPDSVTAIGWAAFSG